MLQAVRVHSCAPLVASPTSTRLPYTSISNSNAGRHHSFIAAIVHTGLK